MVWRHQELDSKAFHRPSLQEMWLEYPLPRRIWWSSSLQELKPGAPLTECHILAESMNPVTFLLFSFPYSSS